VRINRIKSEVSRYLKHLEAKSGYQVPVKWSQIKSFKLVATLREALRQLDKGDVLYSKLKLQDALGQARKLGEQTTTIEAILKEFERPLEEEIGYTFEELRQKLERMNPQKFSILIKDLQRLPEKHQLVFYSHLFENRERAHYSKLFENVRNTCMNFYLRAEGKEKEILDRIMERVDECLRSLNPPAQPKSPTKVQS